MGIFNEKNQFKKKIATMNLLNWWYNEKIHKPSVSKRQAPK